MRKSITGLTRGLTRPRTPSAAAAAEGTVGADTERQRERVRETQRHRETQALFWPPRLPHPVTCLSSSTRITLHSLTLPSLLSYFILHLLPPFSLTFSHLHSPSITITCRRLLGTPRRRYQHQRCQHDHRHRRAHHRPAAAGARGRQLDLRQRKAWRWRGYCMYVWIQCTDSVRIGGIQSIDHLRIQASKQTSKQASKNKTKTNKKRSNNVKLCVVVVDDVVCYSTAWSLKFVVIFVTPVTRDK